MGARKEWPVPAWRQQTRGPGTPTLIEQPEPSRTSPPIIPPGSYTSYLHPWISLLQHFQCLLLHINTLRALGLSHISQPSPPSPVPAYEPTNPVCTLKWPRTQYDVR